MNKIHFVTEMIKNELSSRYPEEEIKSFITVIFEHFFRMSRLQIYLHQNDDIPIAKLTEIKEIVERLKKFEPIQYILGETEFYGLKFKVNPAVLIPRPETEELVQWVLKDTPEKNASLLDIGTGSGCIPIAVKSNRRDLNLEGWDISEEALAIATENALKNKTDVQFSRFDILKWEEFQNNRKKYDVIISNPPYVTESEKLAMPDNVLNHEPHTALFVSDDDPLLYYRKILDFAKNHLSAGGKIYFEINEKFAGDLLIMLTQKGFVKPEIRKDLNSKFRMVKVLC